MSATLPESDPCVYKRPGVTQLVLGMGSFRAAGCLTCPATRMLASHGLGAKITMARATTGGG